MVNRNGNVIHKIKPFSYFERLFYWFISRHLLNLRNALNLDHGSLTRGNSLKAWARRHGLRQEINVNFVHGGKVLHVRKVDVVLDDLLKRGAGQLENFLQVLKNSSLFEARSELVHFSSDWKRNLNIPWLAWSLQLLFDRHRRRGLGSWWQGLKVQMTSD